MNTHVTWTRQLLVRELESLIAELELFPREDLVWVVLPGITNSAGNITLHLCGNLQHFVGKVVGNSGYVRNRELEFSQRDLPRAALISEVRKTMAAVSDTLTPLSDDALLKEYPDVLGGLRLPTGLFLQHLCVHLGHHIGQVGYLRRILTGENKSSGAISMHALAPKA